MSDIVCKSCGKHMKWPYQGHTICYACYHKDVNEGKIGLDTFGPVLYIRKENATDDVEMDS